MRKALLILIAIATLSHLQAQNTTVINNFKGDTTGVGYANMKLKFSEEHTIVINYYENAAKTEEQRLQALITDALNYYVDQSVILGKKDLELRKSPQRMIKEMDNIVNDGMKYYEFKEKVNFRGFSREVVNKLKSIEDLEWGRDLDFIAKARGIEGRSDEEKAYLYVQSYLTELKQQTSKELGMFTDDNLLTFVGQDSTVLKLDQSKLLDELNNFEKNQPLEPLSLDFSLSTMNLIASSEDFSLPKFEYPEEPAVEDDFAKRVFKLLEANNKRLEMVENELLSMKKGSAEIDNSNALQMQINELSARVAELIASSTNTGSVTPNLSPDPLGSTGANIRVGPTTNLPQKVELFFKTGQSRIDLNSEFILGELVDILVKNPRIRIVVTGYADQTGSAEANLKLSQLRAKRVQQRLLQSGVEGHRVMVNFFGDMQASSSAQKDRKVVIEFIKY